MLTLLSGIPLALAVTPAAHATPSAAPGRAALATPAAHPNSATHSPSASAKRTHPASATRATTHGPTSRATLHAQSWAVLAPNRTIHKGQSAYVWVRSGAGALRTAHLRVALHQWTNRGWYAISIHRADRAGRAAFSIVPRRTTAYRVAVVGAGRIATGFSRPVRVTVAGARGHAVVAYAARYRGTPYRYGGAGPRGFDCSGFTQYVFRQFGRALPHSATAQSRYGVRVARAAAVPGDLILFGHRGRYYHAAIYAGRGFMWDASTYGNPVAKRKIYSPRFVVRRVI